jgi:hypothetical protein
MNNSHLDELQQILAELHKNFGAIAHLSLDEQLRKFDEPLKVLEQQIADGEKIRLNDVSGINVMKQLARAITIHPKAQAKAMFIGLLANDLNDCKAREIYLSELQNKFPSSHRISLLVHRYDAYQQYLKTLVKMVEDY